MKYVLLALLALPLCAQTVPPRVPLPQLRKYLELTDTQVSGIVLNNDGYTRSLLERQARIRQVQREIAVETAKDTLDPAALGVRYAEIALICRDLRDLGAMLVQQNLALLNDGQREKMGALEAAMKLMPVATEAQNANMISDLTSLSASVSDVGQYPGYLAVLLAPSSGCVVQVTLVGSFAPLL